MGKKILIISHTFPPTPGIGGRRWAKFAKYLTKQGNNVTALGAKNIFPGSSNWMKDIEGLDLVHLPYHYPKILSKNISSISQKILYHLSLLFVKLLDKGNYFDKSIFWKSQLHKKIKELIVEKKIETIIVTGAPFRLVYYVSLLKKEYPTIQFISDFRDMWTQDLELSAITHLSEKRKKEELFFERTAVQNSDKVFVVSEKMLSYFSSLCATNKCYLLPNGFDLEDMEFEQEALASLTPGENKIQLVFAGTVYNNLNYVLDPFFKSIKKLKIENPSFYKLLRLNFFGRCPEEYKSLVKYLEIDDAVFIVGEQPYKTVAMAIEKAHYCLLFLNDTYNDSFSTKFCEYLGQRKKMIVVSNRGMTSDFVEKNNLGFYLDPTNSYAGLLKCIEKVYENDFKIETTEHFNTDFFAIHKIALKLEGLLNL